MTALLLPSDLGGAAVPSSAADVQVILGALNLADTDEYGVRWMLASIDGLGSPAPAMSLAKRPRSHGAWPGSSFLPQRSMSVGGRVRAPTAAALSDARDRLTAACSIYATVLTVSEWGRVRACVVQRSGDVLWSLVHDTTADWSIQVVAPDPRLYGEQIVQWTNLPSQSGGLTYPITYPLTYPATVTSGTIGINNPGTIASPMRLRIDGPCNGPIITHVASGRSLVFSSSYTLAAGAWLDIDMDARTVMENGQASRNGYVTSRGWFSLDPGDNTIGFNAVTFNPDARLTVYATPAWD